MSSVHSHSTDNYIINIKGGSTLPWQPKKLGSKSGWLHRYTVYTYPAYVCIFVLYIYNTYFIHVCVPSSLTYATLFCSKNLLMMYRWKARGKFKRPVPPESSHTSLLLANNELFMSDIDWYPDCCNAILK